jgi:hypothetical protein
MNKQEKQKLRELYLLLWNKYRDNGLRCINDEVITISVNVEWGICYAIKDLCWDKIITEHESDKLRYDFLSRKIDICNKHYWNKAYNKTQVGYWWKNNEEGYKARLKYLESIIKKLS